MKEWWVLKVCNKRERNETGRRIKRDIPCARGSKVARLAVLALRVKAGSAAGVAFVADPVVVAGTLAHVADGADGLGVAAAVGGHSALTAGREPDVARLARRALRLVHVHRARGVARRTRVAVVRHVAVLAHTLQVVDVHDRLRTAEAVHVDGAPDAPHGRRPDVACGAHVARGARDAGLARADARLLRAVDGHAGRVVAAVHGAGAGRAGRVVVQDARRAAVAGLARVLRRARLTLAALEHALARALARRRLVDRRDRHGVARHAVGVDAAGLARGRRAAAARTDALVAVVALELRGAAFAVLALPVALAVALARLRPPAAAAASARVVALVPAQAVVLVADAGGIAAAGRVAWVYSDGVVALPLLVREALAAEVAVAVLAAAAALFRDGPVPAAAEIADLAAPVLVEVRAGEDGIAAAPFPAAVQAVVAVVLWCVCVCVCVCAPPCIVFMCVFDLPHQGRSR